MQLPLTFYDPAVIEEVPVQVWSALFEAVGWPKSLASKHDSFTHQDVHDALRKDDLTDSFFEALEAVHSLGSEAGRDAIVTAMTDRRVPLNSLPVNSGEREFALRLYLAQRNDASFADVFARAQTQVQEGSGHRRRNEFMGKEARTIKNLGLSIPKLRDQILKHCQECDLGEHVEVRAYEDDGIFVFSILRSDRTKKPLAVVPGHSARAPIEFRPVYGDILWYEPSVGRLRIAARAASMVEFYRGVFGGVLFNDDSFFDGAPVYSLKVLQEQGRAALENHGVFGVARIWMTECLWERGDRNLLQFRSRDCFQSIEELQLPLMEGVLLRAKLKLEVIGKSTRPVTVNIRVPSRIEVSQSSQEPLVERVLHSLGIRGAHSASSTPSFWSLYPWRHPSDVWRTVFRAEMDSLVHAGVLTPIRLDSVAHAQHPDAGRTLVVNQLSDGANYGVSQMPEIASRSVSPTDLDGLELNPEKFRLHLRSLLGISAGGVAWDGSELLELGHIEVGRYRLYAVYALRQPPPGVGERLRMRSGGAHLFLLIPETSADGSELAQVLIGSALPQRVDSVRNAISECGLADVVPAIHLTRLRLRPTSCIPLGERHRG